jgi:hypothetical protein
MMNVLQYPISSRLFLLRYTRQRTAAPPPPPNTNHFLILDVSGSMDRDLPKMRQHLKDKLPTLLLQAGDTLTIIWFSGAGQCGVMFQGKTVDNLADLAIINQSIDRWLRPVGMTNFTGPLQLVDRIKREVVAQTGNPVCSLLFLSDGCHNDGARTEVIKAAQALAFDSVTVVEYGVYADRQLLAQLAQIMGGVHIYSDSFVEYTPVIERVLSQRPAGAWVSVDLSGTPKDDLVFTIDGQELRAFNATAGRVTLPANLETFYMLNEGAVPSGVPSAAIENTDPALYAVLALYATRMRPDVLWDVLQYTGDVKLIEDYSACFGKDRYTAFQQACQQAVFTEAARRIKGFNRHLVPPLDAFTVLDFLSLLTTGDRFLPDHPRFEYKRIGRRRVPVDSVLTKDDIAKIQALTDQLEAGGAADDLANVVAELEQIKQGKQPIRFIPDSSINGYPVRLSFPKDRANINLSVSIPGKLDLSSVLPDHLRNLVPPILPISQHKTYTLFKDGLCNVKVLPLYLSDSTLDKVVELIRSKKLALDVVEFAPGNQVVLVNLDKLPIINRGMAKAASAEELFRLEYMTLRYQARQKVFNKLLDELFPEKAVAGMKERYGAEAAEWLRSKGIYDSGFTPKTTTATATDMYYAKLLDVNLKGLMSLSGVKLEDVRSQMAKNKLTPLGALMVPALAEFDIFKASPACYGAPDSNLAIIHWLKGKAADATEEVRRLSYQIAQQKFAVIVGGVWFKEFASLDENTLTLELDGRPTVCTVTQKEEAVEI